MGKKRLVITSLLVALLFVSAIAGTVAYYNDKMANLNSQVSELKAVIANLSTRNMTASLGIAELLGNESTYMGGYVATPIPYNYLYITGSIRNVGNATAYNVGLHVIAFDATGALEINMTVPLDGIFGIDNATRTFVLEHYGYGNYDPANHTYSNHYSSRLWEIVDGNQTVDIGGAPDYYGSLSIINEGIVTNWTVTPVWTDAP